MNEDLLELFADFIHYQWSHWMKNQFSKMEDTHHHETKKQTGMFMPFEFVVRWQRQMNTPYSELFEKEKDSNREWARKILKLFQDYINKQFPTFIGCIYDDNGCSGYDDGVYSCRRHSA